MYLTITQQINHLSKEQYMNLRDLCHTAKNLTNEAIYTIRQHYFQTGKYLPYTQCYNLLKNSPNYKKLNSNMAQQILKKVDMDFKSFFALLKLKQEGKYSENVRIPHYLKKDGYTNLLIGQIYFQGNIFTLPYSISYKKEHEQIQIRLPENLKEKTVKEIRILPKQDARFFEIQYVYEQPEEQRKLNINKALAIDLGIGNLMTCVSSEGESFIIDGKRLKSINQRYNKKNATLQSIKDRQKIEQLTEQQKFNLNKRNLRIRDYMNKAARFVINYCLDHEIGTLVVGHNTDFQRNSKMSRQVNQQFVQIPFGKLLKKLKYLCEFYGIQYVEQEESYTSKASFWDQDPIPVYSSDCQQTYMFSGKRVKRGQYRTSKGIDLNADVNGTLNILRKSNVVSLSGLYARGTVDVPERIRIV